MPNSFLAILEKYRRVSFSEKDKGERFERLMKAYLLTDSKYAHRFKKIWLWNEFPGRKDLGGSDTGIDLVALTNEGDYWAVQCKCYQADSYIDKPAVDSFLSTSGRQFRDDNLKTVSFVHRLWISTTNKWGTNAEEAIKNQNPPLSRINLFDLTNAPIDWEKLENGLMGEVARTNKKQLRPHQTEALTKTQEYFKANDRGKLIMACGTGKTFNSLRIAENQTQGKGLVLFLVPSIALLGQTLNEWYADAKVPINAICICSDPEITKNRKQVEDIDTSSVIDLALPASTNVESIIKQFKALETKPNEGLTVVFSTYQSIERISEAQKALAQASPQFAEFDLIICDEAHRTTGVSLANEDESAFTKVHNNDFIKAKKRLYMTATPRLYDDNTKSKAAQAEALLCSMDDVALYGEEIYRIGFGEAVEKGLLTDYKVLILTLNANDVPPAVQKMIADQDNEINTDDASKLIGCINALSKKILGDQDIIKETDPEPMRRAVAFCQSIVASKKITSTFNDASETYIGQLPTETQARTQLVASKHIDGSMNATERNELLAWLKDQPKERECRILTNVRCLSEGVDVPSLDAVLFLSARNSQVDVVQSVGRVMRKAEGKKYGYIIIPVVVPTDIEASKALDDNERYKVVWTVLNALRAHDDRFNATVNKIELNKKRPNSIIVAGTEYGFDTDGNPVKKTQNEGDGTANAQNLAAQLALQFEQLQSVVFARMVDKVGDRRYWEQWAKSVADIASRQTERIAKLVNDGGLHQQAFDGFLKGLHKNINPSITPNEAVEMLSQHIITKPVFEALFDGYSFVKNNPISVSMQTMLDLLEDQSFDKDTETLQKFYESVKSRAGGIDNAEGKQKIIVELYDKFFKSAFPKMVEKLGIVYTPVEVVDFMIQSIDDILKKEFGRSISDENIHILDPFTGTGTFMTRLLQSGLIKKEDLERKYTQELHANEIVLLAYYIAAINIENTYHDILNAAEYKSFEGICLTDTFQLGETDASEIMFSEMFPQNSDRVIAQKKAPLRVIIGNPPYSVGQTSANDNAQNQKYEKLDRRIENTYAKESSATSVKALYDSYIKAFRWSTDRLDSINGGMIAFVSNGAWLEGNGADGLRKCLEKEFSAIYVFNLRGNQRTSGELSRKEGGKIFGSGSRTPIAITFLVKNPNTKTEKATIHYHDIGDYLSREDKLSIISKFRSVNNSKIDWQTLSPNEQGDWVSQRNNIFGTFTPIDAEKKYDTHTKTYFLTYSLGLATGRDAWVYNYSKNQLIQNVQKSLDFYKEQLEKYKIEKFRNRDLEIDSFIDTDPTKLSWNRNLKDDLGKFEEVLFNNESVELGLYRPFCKQNLYFDRDYNAMVYQNKKLFPKPNTENKVICVTGLGASKDFSVIISDIIPDLQTQMNGQCFPLYYYEENTSKQKGIFDEDNKNDFIRRDAVSDFILERAKKQYNITPNLSGRAGVGLSKEDIFYYVYGFLHSPEYREMFAADLKKMLPRLPLVEAVKDFWAFSKAGRQLADLHINYESVPPCKGVVVVVEPLSTAATLSQANHDQMEYVQYGVTKMRFLKKGEKETIIYNNQITIDNIPPQAYEYVVNGKSAIEWVMERYQKTTHKESGIGNNPNDWAAEIGKPRYILDLLLSVINVSVQTVEIVNNLPQVEFGAEQE